MIREEHGKETAVEARAKRACHAIKDQIDHPVVDADAHWLEPLPVFFDYVATAGGPGAVDRFRGAFRGEASANNVAAANDWYDFTEAQRLATRSPTRFLVVSFRDPGLCHRLASWPSP